NLVGGSNTTDNKGFDIFSFTATGSISGTVDGGGNLDMITGPDTDNTWTLTGANQGTLNAAADFVNIEALAGGQADDTFLVRPHGSDEGFTDGGLNPDDGTPPVDTLDYSMYGSPVTVNLAANTATGLVGVHGIDAYLGSGNTADVFKGPGESGDTIAWTIDGADAGEVQGVTFTGF